MKKITKYLLAITLFIALPACLTDSNSDDDGKGDIVVPFEMVIPTNQLSDGTWNVSNGMFIATFKARENVTRYEMRVVREDKSKGEAFIRNIQNLQQDGDNLRYGVVIGSTTIYLGVSESRKNAAVAEFQAALNERKHLYHSLEVTPL